MVRLLGRITRTPSRELTVCPECGAANTVAVKRTRRGRWTWYCWTCHNGGLYLP